MASGSTKKSGKAPFVVQPDSTGAYHLPSSALGSVAKVDAADVDIVLTTRNGDHYILPGGAMEAMTTPEAPVSFSDTTVPITALFGQIGTVGNLGTNIPVPSSFDNDNAHGSGQQEQQQQPQQSPQHSEAVEMAVLQVDAAASVEKLVAQAEHISDLIHSHDYDYVPLPRPAPPYGAPPMPPGEPPPASQTPIILLTPGNVTADTTYQPGDAGNPNPGYLTVFAPGGMPSSDVSQNLPPNSPLLFSTVNYENLSSQNVAYYAEGQANLIAGANGGDTSSVYAQTGIDQTVGAKEFILSIAGASIRINDMSIKGVPATYTIVGGMKGEQAADGTYTWTLPINYIDKAVPFTMLYPIDHVSDPNDPASWPAITVQIDGLSTHGFTYHSKTTFTFDYIAQTDPAETFHLPLNTYALPTLDTPYDITLGDGNNIVYGGQNNDTITTGNGNSTIVDGNGDNVITFGSGSNTIHVGTGNDIIRGGDGGNNAITVSSLAHIADTGTVDIQTGEGSDTITVYGGHGVITAHAGTGNTEITINTETGSTKAFTIATTGTGTTSITGGDGEYAVLTGEGASTVSLGAGNDSIVTGTGDAHVSVGHGLDTITTGTGNSYVTVNGGGGTITTGSTGTNVSDIQVRNTSPSDVYNINLNGAGGAIVNAVDGNYTINGSTGTGNDTVTLGAGNSSISTGSGDAEVSVGHGQDTIITGSGNSYVTVNGGGGTITTGSISGKVSDIQVRNTSASDVYQINLNGAGGAIVNAVDGNYTIDGSHGTGNDTITLGAGNSSISTGSGDAQVSVGHGNDTIITGSGNSNITVNGGGGTITTHSAGSKVSNILVQNTSASDVYNINLDGAGGAIVNAVDGNYTVNGSSGTGNDTITLGAGNSSISTGSGDAQVSVGHGHDTITTGSGNSNITVNGGGGTITTYSAGSKVSNITVQNTSASDVYQINLDGSGGAIVNAVDGNYTINGSSGTGNDTITLGAGNSSISTGSGDAQVNVGHGRDTITTGTGNSYVTVNGGGGTITTNASGSNVSNISMAGATGADTYTFNLNGAGSAIVNGGNDNYIVNSPSGTGNDTINLGNGNDTINTGQANASITVGNGNTTITTGSGTNTISVGTGTHNFIASASNSTVNAAAYGATITGGSHDTITSASTTNNYTLGGDNDVINVNNAVGAFTGNGNNNLINVSTTTTVGSSFYGGTGNDTFVGAGTVTDIGADTFYGNGGSALNTGNNTFTNPHAGDKYYGTGGAGVGSINGSASNTSITVGGNTFAINFPWQINGIDYSTDTGNDTINLSASVQGSVAAGYGAGSLVQGSAYGFTSVAGHNSINELILSNTGASTVYSSYTDSIFVNQSTVGGYVYDSTGAGVSLTLPTQHNFFFGGSSYNYQWIVYAGAAQEQFENLGKMQVYYGNSPQAVVLNLTAITQTENFTSGGSIAALSGSGYGSDTTSYAYGDTFVPYPGTSDQLSGNSMTMSIGVPNSTVAGFGTNIVYAPTAGPDFRVNPSNVYANSSTYVFASTTGMIYTYWSNGNNEIYDTVLSKGLLYVDGVSNTFIALSYAFAYANGYTTVNNTSELHGSGSTATLHGLGPTGADATFAGYAYNTTSVQSANTMTLLNGVEYVYTMGTSNDTIIGDNNSNLITGGANNLIIDGNNNDAISATTGNNTIVAGNGSMNITILNSGSSVAGSNSVTLGAGNDTVRIGQSTVVSSGSETVSAGAGNDSITIYTNGNNSISVGAGNDQITVTGSGNESVTIGAGTSVITGGSGTNAYHIDTAGTEALTFTAHTVAGSSWTDSVTGTGVNITAISTGSSTNGTDAFYGNAGNDTFNAGIAADSFYGGSGTNLFNASTLAGAPGMSFTGGIGNSTFVGAGTVTGIGNDTFYGNGGSAANTGNNYFTNPHAGDTYYATGGAGVGSINASSANTSLTLNGNTYAISFPWQLNAIDYSGDLGSDTINLSSFAWGATAAGTGRGSLAQGAIYGFTSVAGYNSINEVITSQEVILSESNSILIDTTSGSNALFYEATLGTVNTLSSQHNIIVAGVGANVNLVAGPSQDQYINLGSLYLGYNYSPKAVVLNLSATAQTENYTSGGSIAALTGSGYGSDTTSYAQGDTFTPQFGTSDNLGTVALTAPASTVAGFGTNIVYAPNGSAFIYQSASPTTNAADYVFGTGTSNLLTYNWSNGNCEFDGSAASTNNKYIATANQIVALSYALAYADGFTAVNNTSELQGTGSTATLHGYGPTGADMVFAGYAYATDTTQSANTQTLLNNVESVLGAGANDTIIGDNNNNMIAMASSNMVIYDGTGNDTINLAATGFNQIHLGTSGTTELNLSYISFTTPTEIVLGNGTFFGGTSDLDTIFGSATTPSYNAQFYGGTYEIYSNGSHISIAGSTYGSGVAASGNTDFGNYDNLYYADSNTTAITANGGNNIIVGSNDGATLTGCVNTNTILYESSTVGGSITDSLIEHSGGTNTLRIPGLVLAAESPTTDPFSSTISGTESVDINLFARISVLDLRTGTDSLTSGTYNGHNYIIDTFGTSLTATNSITMSAQDVINLNHTASGSTVAGSAASSSTPFTLYLDQGDTFTPDYLHGATTMAGGAYDGTAASNYNTNPTTHTVAYEYMNGGTAVAYLNVHFGA